MSLTEEQKEQDMQDYNAMAEGVILAEIIKEGITPDDQIRIDSAPSDEEVSMENLHVPTKSEVLHQVASKVIATKNVSLVISSVEEMKEYVTKAPAQLGDSSNDILQYIMHPDSGKITIEPKVFFEFIKGSLSANELEKLTENLLRFKQILEITTKTGQLALRENARDSIIKIIREQQAAVEGYSRYVNQSTISDFLRNVEGRVAYLKPFSEFPRLLPDDVWSKLEKAQTSGIFEEFWILYLDYSKESSTLKSTSTKIKEKDPILFGKVMKDSLKLFYIADWIDEYCDLTLDKFITEMKAINTQYTLPEVTMPSPADLSELLEDKERQASVLKSTNSSKYRELAAQESKLVKTQGKSSLLSKIFKIFG